MSVKALVFDFGNVIAFFDHRRFTSRVARHARRTEQEIFDFIYGGEFETRFECGRIPPGEFLDIICRDCGINCPAELVREWFCDVFWLNPEVAELIPRLARQLPLLLLSNTNALHAGHFVPRFWHVLGQFSALVLSHEVGARKPERAIFQHAAELAHCVGEDILFIDDLPENVEGARACGWQGLVYRPGEGLHRQLASLGLDV